MNKPMTPGQPFRIGEITAEAAHKAGQEGRISHHSAQLAVTKHCADLGEVVVKFIESLVPINPHKIVAPAWDYPAEFNNMTAWQDQLAILQAIWPSLDDTTGLAESAEGYLAQADIWSETFERNGCDQTFPLYDGLVVFAKPGHVLGRVLGVEDDLYADIESGNKGYWGRLCAEAIFPQFTLPQDNPRFLGFCNYRRGQMGGDCFKPKPDMAEWLKVIESEPGDFACRPFNFGRRLAGYSVEAGHWETENVLDGLGSPSWISSQGLLTNPNRLIRPEVLAIDCADMYRFGDDREFLRAPCFYRRDGRLRFGTYRGTCAGDGCGLAFVRR